MKKINRFGFTFPEVIITVSILLTILGFAAINLLNVRNSTSLNTVLDLLVSDIQNQQMKAISNNTEGRTDTSDYGIHIQTDRYILFHGASYNPNESTNVLIEIDNPLELSTTFPNSTVIFSKGIGEVVNFVENQNTISITDTSQNRQEVITINRLGVITSIQ